MSVFLDIHYIGFLISWIRDNILLEYIFHNQKKGRKKSTPKDTLNVTNSPDGA